MLYYSSFKLPYLLPLKCPPHRAEDEKVSTSLPQSENLSPGHSGLAVILPFAFGLPYWWRGKTPGSTSSRDDGCVYK